MLNKSLKMSEKKKVPKQGFEAKRMVLMGVSFGKECWIWGQKA